MKPRQTQQINEFRHAAENKQGYSCSDVDRFFEQLTDDFVMLSQGETRQGINTAESIRQVSFESESGGYLPADVDKALDRVEDRFALLEREQFVREHGRQAWDRKLEDEASLIMGRLERGEGERFRRPSQKLTKGYYMREVDELCVNLTRYFRESNEFSPGMIRDARFSSATGDLAYDETQVDAFLDRTIALLISLHQ